MKQGQNLPHMGASVLEASMSRVKVTSVRNPDVLLELGKELPVLDEGNRFMFPFVILRQSISIRVCTACLIEFRVCKDVSQGLRHCLLFLSSKLFIYASFTAV